MSQENMEVVKEFTRLLEEGDREVWRDYFAPDVVWDTSATSMPGGRRLARPRRDGAVLPRLARNLDGLRDFTREFVDAGDSVVIVFRQRGTGRESGIQIERDFFGVYDLRGSKVVRYRQYESREEALEAAGLSG